MFPIVQRGSLQPESQKPARELLRVARCQTQLAETFADTCNSLAGDMILSRGVSHLVRLTAKGPRLRVKMPAMIAVMDKRTT